MAAAAALSRIELAEAASAVLAALRGGEPVAVVTMIDVEGDDGTDASAVVGSRMLVWHHRSAGTFGDPALDALAGAAAREAIAAPGAAFSRRIASATLAATVYVEAHGPPPELVIVGAGHIAQPLSRLGRTLGFRVTVLDDRPEFATRERFPDADRVVRADFADPFRDVSIDPATHLVLVTRGHKYDYDALRYALRQPIAPAYVGMVGSRRRVRAALQELAAEGIPRDRLLRINAPIGLDIGAETPEEIAIAIAAEIVRLRRGGTGASLRDRARVVERWIENGDDEG
jgi:xanthine dehydrogenase accessory factor